MDTYYVMSFLNKLPEIGVTKFGDPELHITFLAQVLDSSFSDVNGFVADTARIAENTNIFALFYDEEKTFGDSDKSYKVMTLDRTEEAFNLHQSFVSSVENFGLRLGQPYYAGDNFIPHISFEDEKLPTNPVIVDSLTLVRHLGVTGNVEVLWNVNLEPAF